jgi:hypothetical protein
MQAGASMEAGMSMPRSNGPVTHSEAGMPGMRMPALPRDANQIPLFPQDAFMESPAMAMDKDVEKPETYGLPAGWSGFVGGMMTLVRVLPPDHYEKIMDLKARQTGQRPQESAK